FLGDGHVEAQRPALDHARAHAARGALAAHDQAVDALLLQQHLQRRAAEGAGALFVDDAIARLGRELLADAIVVEIGFRIDPGAVRILELGRGLGRAGGVENRNASLAARREQPLGRLDRIPGVLATGRGKLFVQLADRPVAAGIDPVVEVDRKERGILADADLAHVLGNDVERAGLDHVLPAMIFEFFARHVMPYFASYKRRKRSITGAGMPYVSAMVFCASSAVIGAISRFWVRASARKS